MKRIDEIFNLHRSQSDIFPRYEPGDVPYVGNGLSDNAVLGLVKPFPDDTVFQFRGIAVSAFCEASVQSPPFIGCGRAGNGVVALEPKGPMSVEHLAYTAAYINLAERWRFSWYWQTTATRIGRLLIPDKFSGKAAFDVRAALPKMKTATSSGYKPRFRPFCLGDVFDLNAGDYHNAGALPRGDVPLVSCGDANNGICAFVDVPLDRRYRNQLTISFNGMNTLTTKFHPYEFAAKDDVAVCTPRKPLRTSTLFFIQIMMGRERWRYSFYRKCFMDKLVRQSVQLPATGKEVDEDTIERVVSSSPYWGMLSKRFATPMVTTSVAGDNH